MHLLCCCCRGWCSLATNILHTWLQFRERNTHTHSLTNCRLVQLNLQSISGQEFYSYGDDVLCRKNELSSSSFFFVCVSMCVCVFFLIEEGRSRPSSALYLYCSQKLTMMNLFKAQTETNGLGWFELFRRKTVLNNFLQNQFMENVDPLSLEYLGFFY